MELPYTTPSPEELYKVRFAERWELLKPVLERLYFDEKLKLPEIISLMKSTYNFDANEAQFKYQFNKKWGWKKSIPSSTKEAILEIAQTRAAAGKLTLVRFKNKEINLKKIRRHAKRTARQDLPSKNALQDSAEKRELDFSHEVLLEIRIFLLWNRIFEFEGLPILSPVDIVSPPACAVNPIDLTVATPPAESYIPQFDALYLHSSVMEKKLTSHAHLFIQGRYDELIHDMVRNEMTILSTWLYHYWQFTFHTAKFWGNGPRNWTSENLKLRQILEVDTLTFSDPPLALGVRTELGLGSRQALQAPKTICYWSIHISDKDWKNWKPRDDLNSLESAMKEWPEHWKNPAVEKRFQNALNSNNFSNIKSEDLPMALHQLAKTINKSTNQFLQMSLSFSIMAGNSSLIEELLGKAEAAEVDLSELFPYHLATSYLDGSIQCCQVFGLLCRRLGDGKFSLARCYTDHLGHSVLDNLMIAILKGHTSITPGIVNNGWRNQSRFAGDEMDICGRWAPDSNELATVLASGVGGIPSEWKHKFCHTSAQVILHCIQAAEFYGADLNTSSGLYLKICFSCGSKLQLQPLHTLIFTACLLAQFGRTGEDMFGIIAYLLCLLQLGVDPSRKSTISTTILLDQAQDKTYCHSEMTPLQLAESLGLMFSNTWNTKLQVGWKIICHLLGLGEAERDKWELRHPSSASGVAAQDLEASGEIGDNTESVTPNGYQIGCDDCIWGEGFFGNNKYLGHIWAAVQTELLTHRRRQDEDHWMSENFEMDALLGSLQLNSELDIGYVKRGVMKKYCSCGSFTEIPWPNLSLGKEVTASILESSKYFDAGVGQGLLS